MAGNSQNDSPAAFTATLVRPCKFTVKERVWHVHPSLCNAALPPEAL
jgi:hypothetical protein